MATYSFEFFPPKNEAATEHLWQAVAALAQSKPLFMTMTFGAGGSTRDGTLEGATRIRKETKIPTAAHLTCVGLTKDELGDYTEKLWAADVRHIVALRGDIPAGGALPDYKSGKYYQYASDFVAALNRGSRDFEISVAAYPEKHPQAADLASDIEALKKKCTGRVKRAITQFFFDNADFYRFLDKTTKAGISTPIVPGLLPIMNFAKMVSFAGKCGARVPKALHERFSSLNEEDTHKAAEEILVKQVEDLVKQGASHFHFYTLNRAELCLKACEAIKRN